MKTLTVRQKNILDRVLWVVGALLGFIAANTPSIIQIFPASEQGLAIGILTGVGILGGDVVSDIVGMVDTGTITAVQATATWADTKAYVTSTVIPKLPAADQTLAALALSALDAKVTQAIGTGQS